MNLKKVFGIVLTTVMMGSMIAGCSSNQKVESSSEGGKEVTLKVLAGQSTTDAGIEDIIDKALAKKYPNIKLEWECVGWGDDFQAKIQQYMQTGMPDIIIGKAQDVGSYGSKGIFKEIDSTYTSRLLDAASDNVKINGKPHGLVYNALYQGVYYNKDMFEKNGWKVPKTLDDLNKIIQDCKAKGIVPFASHMADAWSIGNVTMQFSMNDIFNKNPKWGDQFRKGEVSFTNNKEMQDVYKYNKLIFDNTFPDTLSLEQTECDSRMVKGQAAMKVSGSWSIQNFLDIDANFNMGIFPFPNKTGDSKLIFEPNITFMTSATTKYQDAVNNVFDVLTSDKDLAVEIYDFTKTAPMLKDVTPTFKNPSQADIDNYAKNNMIVDVTLGNNQLVWNGFQDENAKDIAAWLLGDEKFEDALAASDSRAAHSGVSSK